MNKVYIKAFKDIYPPKEVAPKQFQVGDWVYITKEEVEEQASKSDSEDYAKGFKEAFEYMILKIKNHE